MSSGLSYQASYWNNPVSDSTPSIEEVHPLSNDHLRSDSSADDSSLASDRPLESISPTVSPVNQNLGPAPVDLHHSAALLQATFEAMTDGVLSVDCKGQVTCFNHRFVEMWQIPASLIATRDDDRLLSYVLDQLQDPTAFIQKVQTLYAKPADKSFDLVDLKDGRVFERQSLPQRIGESIVGRIWTFRDITEQIRTETALRQSEVELRQKAEALEYTLHELKQTQLQLVQSEKMLSLGKLVAGIAHEINNPVNFIAANIGHLNEYVYALTRLILLYQQHHPRPIPEIQEELEAMDLDFLLPDLAKILSSMKVGTDRLRQLILSLRNFSRLDEAEKKLVDVHEGIDSTLMILQHRLNKTSHRPAIQVLREYGNLPRVECYAGQLNQVFMNILANAIDAIDQVPVWHILGAEDATFHEQEDDDEAASPDAPTIQIKSEFVEGDRVKIYIIDNGSGMTEDVKSRLFDPFFTTKPVGQGTGLGLSISYQIIERHRGSLQCTSKLGQGTTFEITVPVSTRSC